MNYVLVNTWVEGQKYTEMSLEELAKIRHEEMGPSNPDLKIKNICLKNVRAFAY